MRFGAILKLLLSLLLTTGSSRAQDSPTEYQVKAAFIFNFAKFVEWPRAAFTNAKAPLRIGVLGENPFGPELERAVRGKTLNNRPIQVEPCSTVEDAKRCHLLFISASEKPHLEEIFKGLGGTNLLTVGETENFIKSGGMISFFWEGKKIRFQINDEMAKKAGLKIDSKLLDLGRKPVD